MDTDTARHRLARLAAQHPDLRLLVLHGSRVKQQSHASSDWDLAYLAGAGFDPLALLADATSELGTDSVDLVDLATASGVLRFRVARDGVPVHDDPPGTHRKFVLAAVHFWCDAGPVIEAAHESVLAELG